METFHNVRKKDVLLEANLRKAPKLTTKVLYPGNCKQNDPTARAIFHETAAAAIQSCFPDESSTAEFLKLFSKWWSYQIPKLHFLQTITLQTQQLMVIKRFCLLPKLLAPFKKISYAFLKSLAATQVHFQPQA